MNATYHRTALDLGTPTQNRGGPSRNAPARGPTPPERPEHPGLHAPIARKRLPIHLPERPPRRQEAFLNGREIFLCVAVPALLLAWVLELAPLLHASHTVRSAAIVAANLAATGSGQAEATARRWVETRPDAPARIAIRRIPGPGRAAGRVEASVALDYVPATPVVRAFLPRVIRLEATEVRDLEP